MLRVSVVLLLALLVAAPAAAAAERRVPQGWLGVVADGPLSSGHEGEWDRMVAAGVESVRTAFRWSDVQPYPSAAAIASGETRRFRDIGGIPTDFSRLDRLVAMASRRGLELLPVVESTPAWAALRDGKASSPPRDAATFRRFVVALVHRYGPRGSFWRERRELPRMPIRAWQIWNEPGITFFWSEQPFAASFVHVLRAAANGIRAADPGAKIVLAGLNNRSWEDLGEIYAAGGGGHFDAVAIHPYTYRPADVLRVVRRARRVMRANGDGRLPVWVTEFSWTAARDETILPDIINTTARGQARNLRKVLRGFAAMRRRARIERVFWYTWLSSEQPSSSFNWSGLRRLRSGSVVSVPALAAFRRAARRLEGCAKARGDARRCR